MALNIPLTTMALTCFNRDEIEDMLQWRVIQDGQFLDVDHGTYAHLYERERRMHWFHYLEEEGEDGEASWRLDLHYEAGKDAVREARLEDNVEWALQVADMDSRFHLPVPVVFKNEDEEIHLVVEMVNKNMIPKNITNQDLFDVNIHFVPFNFELFPSKDDIIASMQHETKHVPQLPNIFPMGILLDQMMSKNEIDEEMQDYLQNIVATERINPVLLTHIAAPIVKVDEIPLGNEAVLYDVTIKTEAGEFHMPISNIYPESQDLEAGLYMYVTGYFSAMYLSDAKQNPPKENVIPFNVLN